MIFSCLRSEVNVDRNLNIEGSADKLAALVLTKTCVYITYFEKMCHFVPETKICMGPFLGMMPSNALSVETWCIAGHHAQEHAPLCLQPPRIAGHDAQERASSAWQ